MNGRVKEEEDKCRWQSQREINVGLFVFVFQ